MAKSFLERILPYILVALLCVALWYANGKSKRYKMEVNALEQTVNDYDQEIKNTRLRLSDSIEAYQSEVSNLMFTCDNLKAKYGQLLKAADLKAKDVGSVTEIVRVTESVDTVYARESESREISATLKDRFIDIDVLIFPDLNTIIKYEVRDSLTIINVQKKHSWLFGLIKWSEHKSTRVIDHNPNARIVGLRTVDVFE